MIEKETDMKVLEAILHFLENSKMDPTLRIKLTERALQAEEDIARGRLFTKQEVIRRTNR